MLFIRLTEEQLEKARKSPRLVPVRRTVTRDGTTFQMTVWVSPEDARSGRASGGQGDLFDGPPPAMQGDLFDQAPAKEEPKAVSVPPELYLRIEGSKTLVKVGSLKEASEKFAMVRDAALESGGGGASKMPLVEVVDGNGKPVGVVSYNGRIWKPEEYGKTGPGIKPIYDNWTPKAVSVLQAKQENSIKKEKQKPIEEMSLEEFKGYVEKIPTGNDQVLLKVGKKYINYGSEAGYYLGEKNGAKKVHENYIDSVENVFYESNILAIGSTKTQSGITYRLNENHRWERVDEQQKKPRATKKVEAKKTDSGDDLDPNSENYRFKDTGYVAGSRKELAAERIKDMVEKGQLVRKRDLDWKEVEKNPRRAQTLIVKSNLFGKVPWEELRDNGMDPGAGFLIDRVYASIASEPDNDPAKRQDYVYGIESIRDRMEACKSVDDVLGVLKQIGEEIKGEMLSASESEEYQAAYAIYSVMATDIRDKKAGREEIGERLSEINHRKNSLEWEQGKRTRRGWKPDPELAAGIKKLEPEIAKIEAEYDAYKARYPEYFDDVKRNLANGYSTYASTKEMEAREYSDKLERIKRTAAAANLLGNPTTRAWQALGTKFWSAINYRSYKGSDAFGGHVANARAGRIKDWSWMEKDRAGGGGKKPTEESVRFQLKVAENFERKGGRTVDVDSTLALKKMFGLREVQSGNWVLKDVNSAKFHTEQSAQAFADMADLLGIPDGQVSLNGRLALAFGARGTGSSGWKQGAARAHYEPVERVINITKMGGGGALGHEWFHAFDNMLTEAMGLSNGDKDLYLSENPDIIADPELKEAFKGLTRAMKEGSIVPKKKITYDAKDISAARGIDRMSHGLYAAIKSAGSAQAAISAISARYAQYNEGDKDKYTKKAMRQRDEWMRAAAAYYDKQPGGGSVEVQAGAPHSAFMEGARELDGSDKKPYWSQGLEMAARAFQSYCEDRLGEKGQKNDYLSVYADNKYHRDPLFGIEWKPYPEGEERVRINAAFDKLFEVVRSKNLIQKAIDAENRRMVKSVLIWTLEK